MPVFPAVASMTVPPRFSLPSRSARSIKPMAARSFTLPPGFMYSSLAKISADPACVRFFIFSILVLATCLAVATSLVYASLAKISADPAGVSFFICSIGVSPTSLEISSLTRRREFEVDVGTLQSKERNGAASMRGIGNPPLVAIGLYCAPAAGRLQAVIGLRALHGEVLQPLPVHRVDLVDGRAVLGAGVRCTQPAR